MLIIGCEYLEKVDWEDFSKILTKIRKVSLDHTTIPPSSICILFSQIAMETHLILEDLDICGMQPRDWPPCSSYNTQVVISGIIRLKCLNIAITWMTKDFQNALWRAIVEEDHLVLGKGDLSKYQYLGVWLNVKGPALGASYSQSFITEELSMWLVPLKESDAVLLSKAVVRLKAVNLSKSQLTKDQLSMLFTTIEQHCALRLLNLDGNNLRFLSPVKLCSAITRIEEVHLESQEMSLTQLKSLLHLIVQSEKKSCKLVKLFLPVFSRGQNAAREWADLSLLIQEARTRICIEPGWRKFLGDNNKTKEPIKSFLFCLL